jgi:FtsP/CotA-like multicopper oxidase with cupredoxin domain
VSQDKSQTRRGVPIDRRSLLKGGAVLLGGAFAGSKVLGLGSGAADAAVGPHRAVRTLVTPGANEQLLHFAATDGWVTMPQAPAITPFWPDPLAPAGYNVYAFGFRDVTGLDPADANVTTGLADISPAVTLQRGLTQIAAPILCFDEYDEAQNNAVRITLSNLGLQLRPDLVDGHTIHWHGFVNAIPLFDGVPELSISVPIGRSFTYYYRPRDAGTYMYHCHFEDVEHVQMGMTGVVFVRPKQNGSNPNGAVPSGRRLQYAYNDGDGSTQYDREFSFMVTELWVEGHYRDAHIQTTDWTEFKPSFWLLNGRAWPDTLEPNTRPEEFHDNSTNPSTTRLPLDPAWDALSGAGHPISSFPGGSLRYNPISSLITANAGDRVLLRLSNLGYQHHAFTLDGIPMTVVAKDARRLANGGTNLYYQTNTVEVGPGESRDVIFTAPAKTGSGPYDAYRFYDRNYAYLNNGGGAGYGGQMTEVRVFPGGALAAQKDPKVEANDAVIWA